jgi:hypothetical protein
MSKCVRLQAISLSSTSIIRGPSKKFRKASLRRPPKIDKLLELYVQWTGMVRTFLYKLLQIKSNLVFFHFQDSS